jgi:ribosomal protein L14E/L6E/L27E
VVIEEVVGRVVTTWVDRIVGGVVVVLKIVDNNKVVVVIYMVDVVTVALT